MGLERFALIITAIITIHLVAGRLTAMLWQARTYHEVPDDDLKAIRVMWFVFFAAGAGAGHDLDAAGRLL